MKVYVLLECTGAWDDYRETIIGVSRDRSKIEDLQNSKLLRKKYIEIQVDITDAIEKAAQHDQEYINTRSKECPTKLPDETDSEFGARKTEFYDALWEEEERIRERIGCEVLKQWGLNRNFMPKDWWVEYAPEYKILEFEEL